MGLLDKKRSDGFSAPVEKIDLSAPQRTVTQAAQPAPVPAAEPEVPRYGIQQAIELMRLLPPDNVELVVQVVKRTLESVHVRVETIIQDATRKQNEIQARVGVLTREIDELEREISTRRGEIGRLEADHQETSRVKERLLLAEKLVQAQSAVPSPVPTTSDLGGGVSLPGMTALGRTENEPSGVRPLSGASATLSGAKSALTGGTPRK